MSSLSIQRNKAVIAAENLVLLTRAQIEFEHSAIESGKDYFRQVCKAPFKEEHGVYKSIWQKRGSPSGNSEYGRFCFHSIGGLSSTAKEKAEAISAFVRSERLFFEVIHYPHLKTTEDRDLGDTALGKKALEPTEADYIRDYNGFPREVPIRLSTDFVLIAQLAAPLVLGVAQGINVMRGMTSASTATILGSLPDHVHVGGGHIPPHSSRSITDGFDPALVNDFSGRRVGTTSEKTTGFRKTGHASDRPDPVDFEPGGCEYERMFDRDFGTRVGTVREEYWALIEERDALLERAKDLPVWRWVEKDDALVEAIKVDVLAAAKLAEANRLEGSHNLDIGGGPGNYGSNPKEDWDKLCEFARDIKDRITGLFK